MRFPAGRAALDLLACWLSRAAARVYFREIAVDGLERFPSGVPVIVVANHGNAFLDAILLLGFLPVRPRFLAASSLWRRPLVLPLLFLAGIIPVQRREDAVEADNAAMFSACHRHLAAGKAVALFPEGETHDDPHPLRARTGAARIAIAAVRTGGASALRIVPVGLHYDHKDVFRSRAAMIVGEPLDPGTEAAHEEGAYKRAVHALTNRMEEALRRTAPDFSSWEEARLAARAAAILGSPEPGDPGLPSLAERVETHRRFAEGYRLLSAQDPEGVAEVVRLIRRYDRLLKNLGLRDSQVAARYSNRHAFAFALRGAATLVVGFPAALAGIVLNWVPYRMCALASSRIPERDEVSSYKLMAALVFYPLTWFAEIAAAGAAGGPLGGMAAAVVAPASGWVALRFLEDWDLYRSEAQAFLVLRTRTRMASHLSAMRDSVRRAITKLVKEHENLTARSS